MSLKNIEDPYYYWYETLQRSDTANWYDGMKANLTKSDTYEEWYRKYNAYFIKNNESSAACVIDSQKQYEASDPYRLLISIQLNYPTNEIVEAVKNILKDQQSFQRSDPDVIDLGTVFQFASNPDCPTLKTLLEVYDLLNVESQPTLYDVGVQLELSPKSVIDNEDSPKDKRDKTTTMNSLVSKYYRWSKELIANAEEGFFPVYGTIKKPKRNEFGFLIHH